MSLVSRRFRAGMMLGAVALIGCGGAGDERSAAAVPSGAGPDCAPRSLGIEVSPPDSFSAADRCRLVRIALRTLAAAPDTSGVSPADTAYVAGALLTPLSLAMPDGTIPNPTWHVSLSLRGRPYDAEVIIVRATGRATVSRFHKPL